MPAALEGSISGAGLMSFDGEVWNFAVHETGDIRNACSMVGNALTTDSAGEEIQSVTIAAPGSDPQEFTQNSWDVTLGDIIGNAILFTTERENPSTMMLETTTIGCCVMGKGSPPVQENLMAPSEM